MGSSNLCSVANHFAITTLSICEYLKKKCKTLHRQWLLLYIRVTMTMTWVNLIGQEHTVNIQFYNIASRAAQSNSVYISVLKIPIVHADSVSKSLHQNFFFALVAIVSAGKNNIFCDNNGYKQRLSPPVPKQRQFSDLFPWARVLKWGRKREKQRERRLCKQSLLLSIFCIGFDAQFHWLCYKTIGSCF